MIPSRERLKLTKSFQVRHLLPHYIVIVITTSRSLICVSYPALTVDNAQRRAHDSILNGHSKNRPSVHGSGPMSDYRKVYAPRPPPGFKIFDPKKHYDMHYGEGIMWEEIERARQRAEKASGRKGGGYEYESPLGKGFDFQEGMGDNPFRSTRNNKKPNGNKPRGGTDESENIEYEEGYMDMGSSNYMGSKKNLRGREIVSERMKERRKFRRRNRGDPLNDRSGEDESCAIM